MDIFGIYIIVFFLLFLVFPSIFFFFKCSVWCCVKCFGKNQPSRRPHNQRDARRTTIYTITGDQRGNDPSSNFQDFFWDIAPQTSNSRAEQLKDDKDLPSYEEVMQMDLRQPVVGTETLPPPATITPTTNTTSAAPVTSVTPDRVTSI